MFILRPLFKHINSYILPVAFMLPLVSCGNNIAAVNNEKEQIISSSSTTKSPENVDFELLIEQKRQNGELISIGSKGVQHIAIDGFTYPVDKLIKNQLRIEIPELLPGKHELNLSLYAIKEPITVPLIIPNLKNQKVFVLLRLAVDSTSKEVKKIEYGYDFDRNGIIDIDLNRFESVGTKIFYEISPNGQKQKIALGIDTGKTVPNEQVPPPGVVPSSAPQSGKKVDSGQPQTQIPEPPKPTKTSDTELYPLPPSNPTPVPEQGGVPSGQQPPSLPPTLQV